MAEVGVQYLPSTEEVLKALHGETPRRWGIRGIADLSLAIEPIRRMVWLLARVGNAQQIQIPPIGALQIEYKGSGNDRLLGIGIANATLIPEFLSFVATLLQRWNGEASALESLMRAEIAAWSELLSPPPILGQAAQIGLIGELWLLYRLIAASGPAAVYNWMGPAGELHDFHLPGIDVEVKTTLAHNRVHIISSALQSIPSPDRALYVLSIQVKPLEAAPGVTLPEAVRKVAALLPIDNPEHRRFRDNIAQLGYSDEHESLYTTRLTLRTHPVIIPVDENFPAINNDALQNALGQDNFARLRSFTYRVALDGLGVPWTDAKVFQPLLAGSKELFDD